MRTGADAGAIIQIDFNLYNFPVILAAALRCLQAFRASACLRSHSLRATVRLATRAVRRLHTLEVCMNAKTILGSGDRLA